MTHHPGRSHPIRFLEFLRRALSEDNGSPSFTRLQVFLTTSVLVPPVSAGFLWVCYKHPELIIPYLMAIVGLIPVLLGLKVWQKGKEQKVEDPQPMAEDHPPAPED